MHRIAALALAAALASATPATAQSARFCAPDADALVQRLGAQYGEALSAAGVDANGGFVQVYSNGETGTWTIAITIPGGPTCIVSAGEGWTVEAPASAAPQGQPS
ncbi:hypothetical protein [Thalassobaculum sp.]|uniref:hypothetical protein n=1 Tax=Thalassobaculum sp. TaxID=2022740 RepID=UPI0032EFC543